MPLQVVILPLFKFQYIILQLTTTQTTDVNTKLSIATVISTSTEITNIYS